MDTKKAKLSYPQIVKAINDFDRVIPWVRDGDLTFDLNFCRSMHQEVKEKVEETRDEITEKYQREMTYPVEGDDDEGDPETRTVKLFRAPDGRLVARIKGAFEFIREVPGNAATKGTELRPTGATYIKDEDRKSDTAIQTQNGEVTLAQRKQNALTIAPTDEEAYSEELESLNDRKFKVRYTPIDPDEIRDDENVDSEASVNYSNIMHVFEGVPHPAKIDGE